MKAKVRIKAVHTGTRIEFLFIYLFIYLLLLLLFCENPDLDTQFHFICGAKQNYSASILNFLKFSFLFTYQVL